MLQVYLLGLMWQRWQNLKHLSQQQMVNSHLMHTTEFSMSCFKILKALTAQEGSGNVTFLASGLIFSEKF